MDIVVLAFGIALVMLSIGHELHWRLFILKRKETSGTVIAYEDVGSGEHPVIEIDDGDKFTSKYGGSFNPKIGTRVRVFRRNGKAEMYSISNRYLFGVVALLSGAGLIWLSSTI